MEETRHDDHYDRKRLLNRSNLFIHSKYKSIKEEIIYNNQMALTVKQYKLSLKKAENFDHCVMVKSMQTRCIDYLEYGVNKGSVLSMDHLLSIVFYTDWTELSATFTSTFRRRSFYESLSSTKQRNSEYAIWSKHLREVVEYWGSIGWNNDKDKEWNLTQNRIKGPFYCGISGQMVLPEYNIRLCGPTSTSSAEEVAHRFGGESGIILRLNNNETISSYYVRIFGCAWISNHRDEEEFLFCGGNGRMQVENVRIIGTNVSYERYLRPLHYFDCILNESKIRHNLKIKVNDDDIPIMIQLIHHKLCPEQYQNVLPPYINRSFNAYIANKHSISLNLEGLRENFKDFLSLIITPLHNVNCLNLEIFNLFENLQNVNIIANGQRNTIDILPLLGSLQNYPTFTRNQIQFTIKAKHPTGNNQTRSWIYDQYKQTITKNTAKQFNLKLYSTKLRSNKHYAMFDIISITPISDTWNCPICFYIHARIPLSCTICGYRNNYNDSISKSIDHLQKLELYQQIWLNRDPNPNTDELYTWEIQNQQEIEFQLQNQDEKQCIDDTPREYEMRRRETIKRENYQWDLENHHIDEKVNGDGEREDWICPSCTFVNAISVVIFESFFGNTT